jgi:hypothetical protein
MSYTSHVVPRPTTDTSAAGVHRHPRGRGFSILSRLARESQTDTPVSRVSTSAVATEVPAEMPAQVSPEPAPHAEPEWTAPVIPLDRTEPAPRHRRDVDVEPARRSS